MHRPAVKRPAVKRPAVNRLAVIAATVLLAGAADATAQNADSLRATFDIAKRKNWHVRVYTPSSVADGRVLWVHDTAATIGRQRVRYREVGALDRAHREGSAARPGAIAGGLLVGAFGYALSGLCYHDCGKVVLGMTAAGAGAGAALGAFIGHAINPGVLRWERIWTAPDGILATGDTLRVPLPAPPPPRRPSRIDFTTYVGGLFYLDDRFGPPILPATIGAMVSRDFGDVEVIFIDANLSRVEDFGYIGGFVGANWFVQSATYLGATAGVIDADTAPIIGLKLGVTDRTRSGLRLELRMLAAPTRPDRPFGYINVGYTIR